MFNVIIRIRPYYNNEMKLLPNEKIVIVEMYCFLYVIKNK